MFDRKGVVLVARGDGVDGDELTMAAADGGAEDVRDDDGVWQVIADPADLPTVRSAVEDAGFPVESVELAMLPQSTVAVETDQARSLIHLVEALEDNDDIQDVFFNFDIPEAVLEEA